MPEFIPFAGCSPSCCVVLVQIEHWAEEMIDNSEQITVSPRTNTIFFADRIMAKLINNK